MLVENLKDELTTYIIMELHIFELYNSRIIGIRIMQIQALITIN